MNHQKYQQLSVLLFLSFLISFSINILFSYLASDYNFYLHCKSISYSTQKQKQISADFIYEVNEIQDEIDYDQIYYTSPNLLQLFKQELSSYLTIGFQQKKHLNISPIYLEIQNLRV